MRNGRCWLSAFAILALGLSGRAGARSSPHPSFAGVWTLNRDLSEFPRDIGFDIDVTGGAASAGSTGGRGRGGRGGGGIAIAGPRPMLESQIDFTRSGEMIEEVRTPPTSITIGEDGRAIRITDDRGRARTFHTDGKEDSQTLATTEITTKAKWDGPALVVDYTVFKDQVVRYTYTRAAGRPALLVRVEFIQRGTHDPPIKRVYDGAR